MRRDLCTYSNAGECFRDCYVLDVGHNLGRWYAAGMTEHGCGPGNNTERTTSLSPARQMLLGIIGSMLLSIVGISTSMSRKIMPVAFSDLDCKRRPTRICAIGDRNEPR
jgi:hypothetical protein